MLSAAVGGCLETSCPSTDLNLSSAISFYTASCPQGFAPWGGREEQRVPTLLPPNKQLNGGGHKEV